MLWCLWDYLLSYNTSVTRAYMNVCVPSIWRVGEHIKITQDVLSIAEKVLQLDFSNLPRLLNILMKSVEDIGESAQDTDARKYGAKGRGCLWHAGQKQNAAESSLQIRLLAAVGGVR